MLVVSYLYVNGIPVIYLFYMSTYFIERGMAWFEMRLKNAF